MLPDQATQLRNLVRRSGRALATGAVPPFLAVAGGKQGVGVTTLAVGMARALGEAGTRVVLADTNLLHADVAGHFGLPIRGSIVDLLQARRGIHEVLAPAREGVHVLPGSAAPLDAVSLDPQGVSRLIFELQSLGRHADTVVLDLGAVPNALVRSVWRVCDHIILVTTPSERTVMETYAMIKTTAHDAHPVLHLVVNRAASADEAGQIYQRMADCCERFLKLPLHDAGWIPEDDRAALRMPAREGTELDGPLADRAAALAAWWQRLVDQRAAHAAVWPPRDAGTSGWCVPVHPHG